ncbi:lysine N(6)-hydroxylase/L-ornithine N(5)-oxygenase family protein [Acinetobacter bereziniae]|uniref:lysine N(6)-hydroxylase/L-ornithine N(5)-oxygenase family protein n=1 Tax=Acinetobacter bereziniae TaxID=106648 RepID=UPI00124F8C29|nr:SidA/IucD/PvdA family monooxygenase [Acinetobacter bereziniae]
MLDFIAVGLGPFNLSLASLLHKKSDLQYLFFEKKEQFDWHAGMQLPNTLLQVPFMADLVSMVDPTSPFSFLNYLKDQQRLYKFYFLEQPHIPRKEYNHYCQWVADQLECIQYLSTVTDIIPKSYGFEVSVHQDGIQQRYNCRNLVLGAGNVPYVPQCVRKFMQAYPERCKHSADYLKHSTQDLQGNVVVLGSGQSAAEIFLDLFDRQYQFDQVSKPQFNLNWLTRANGFFPMEYTPLGLEHFSPDYIQHFYKFDDLNKDVQLAKQAYLYKGISAQTIREIYKKLYHRNIANQQLATHLHSQSNLIDAALTDKGKIKLIFQDRVSLNQFSIDSDYVVCATGYTSPEFEFLKHVKPHIQTNAQGHWDITVDYRTAYTGIGEIYVQNMEMHSHGVGTPDLGLGAYRAATIANQLLGYALYDLPEQSQCFQHFDPLQNPQVQAIQKNPAVQSYRPSNEIEHSAKNLKMTSATLSQSSQHKQNPQRYSNIEKSI